MEDYKKPIIIRKVSSALWARFKKICQAEDVSMNRQVKKLVAEYVAKKEGKA